MDEDDESYIKGVGGDICDKFCPFTRFVYRMDGEVGKDSRERVTGENQQHCRFFRLRIQRTPTEIFFFSSPLLNYLISSSRLLLLILLYES